MNMYYSVLTNCTEKGYTTYTCSVCHDSYTADEKDAIGHSYTSLVTKQPSCTEVGIRTFTCSKCNNSFTEDIPVTGHRYGEWTITVHPSEATPGEKRHTCSLCGHSESKVIDPMVNVPTITVDDVRGRIGEEITVNVGISENPGIISMSLMISYDTEVVELLSATAVDFAGLSFGPTTANPFVVTWEDVLSGNNSTNGTFVQLKFKVKEGIDAVDSTQIIVAYDEENIFNAAFENVFFDIYQGEIDIIRYNRGDVNRDGIVNMKDYALLKQYINGWEVDIELSVADVTGDGEINMKDYALLKQYINGWDVVLK